MPQSAETHQAQRQFENQLRELSAQLRDSRSLRVGPAKTEGYWLLECFGGDGEDPTFEARLSSETMQWLVDQDPRILNSWNEDAIQAEIKKSLDQVDTVTLVRQFLNTGELKQKKEIERRRNHLWADVASGEVDETQFTFEQELLAASTDEQQEMLISLEYVDSDVPMSLEKNDPDELAHRHKAMFDPHHRVPIMIPVRRGKLVGGYRQKYRKNESSDTGTLTDDSGQRHEIIKHNNEPVQRRKENLVRFELQNPNQPNCGSKLLNQSEQKIARKIAESPKEVRRSNRVMVAPIVERPAEKVVQAAEVIYAEALNHRFDAIFMRELAFANSQLYARIRNEMLKNGESPRNLASSRKNPEKQHGLQRFESRGLSRSRIG